jgi:hypothetical protein
MIGECWPAVFGYREPQGKMMIFKVWLSLNIQNLQKEGTTSPELLNTKKAGSNGKKTITFSIPNSYHMEAGKFG